MIKKIKKLIRLYKDTKLMDELIEEQKEYIKELENSLKETEEKIGNPKYVAEKMFENGIKWYDYEELNEADRKFYYEDAQRILKSKVFQNEKKHIVADNMEKAVLGSKDYRSLRDFQMLVAGIMLLEERLEEIFLPKK